MDISVVESFESTALASGEHLKEELSSLLIDCVESGASVGFIHPFVHTDAMAYWEGVEADMSSGIRKLILAHDGDKVLGSVQLCMADKRNAQHRAEVEKLMVRTCARGKGIAKKLMLKLEPLALELDRTLIVLDTRKGDVASTLYLNLGYSFAGEIPNFALSSDGEYEATVLFYKEL
ncbi:GNAT family N-acetyltransferase [uncultured Shewanella sp.]|uniref:GNAT family N-acetyltransferase n=1 Tax=uncultured Shewanella sp. TaxID=173975 RepID=UPI00262EAC5F|nr:GNAT family N-acetyltransferase [uncultured Shewanella sp.]